MELVNSLLNSLIIQHEGSTPLIPKPAIGQEHELLYCNLHTTYFPEIHFNIILLSVYV